MIIWKGFGILIAIAGIGALIVAGLTFDYFAYDWSHEHTKITEFVCMLFTAAVLFGVAMLLRALDKPRVLIDPGTGREVLIRRGDSLFFIPAIAWPFIVVIIAIAQLIFK